MEYSSAAESNTLVDRIKELSTSSKLTWRSADRKDPPWFEAHHTASIVYEELLPTTICEVCRTIRFLPPSRRSADEKEMGKICFPDDEPWEFERRLFYIHHPSLKSLYSSANDGCQCCLLIQAQAFSNESFSDEIFSSSTPVILTTCLSIHEYHWSEDWYPGNGSYINVYHMGHYYAFASLRILQLSNSITRVIQETVKPPLSKLRLVSLGKMWLANCWMNNPDCFQTLIPPLPTRVLDVGPQDGSQLPRVVTPRIPARYLTLSHCWGKANLPRTLISNYEARCRAIAMEELTQTMKDAIFVTRQYGMRYIWIDSLCIIQDSAEDWAKESAKMCTFYQNALFTIAASRARDGNDGLFSSQMPLLYTPCLLPQYEFLSNGGNKFHIHLTADQEPDDMGYGKNLLTGPLYDRAWVLQEEKLSHATLAFTDHGITWTCAYSMVTARDPEGVDDHLRSEPLKDAIFMKRKYSRDPRVLKAEKDTHKTDPEMKVYTFKHKRDQIYENWTQILEFYLLREITVPSDRLPALSGLAAATTSVLSTPAYPEVYIAGIWVPDLARQLCWTPSIAHFQSREHLKLFKRWQLKEKSKERNFPPRLYVAPSWSWASMYETPVS